MGDIVVDRLDYDGDPDLSRRSFNAEKPLAWMSFAITGTLSKKREEVVRDITEAGGRWYNKFPKKPPPRMYLVVGAAEATLTTQKILLAERHDVPLITEAQLRLLIDGSDPKVVLIDGLLDRLDRKAAADPRCDVVDVATLDEVVDLFALFDQYDVRTKT